MSTRTGIDALLRPQRVAVVGASDDQRRFGGRFWSHLKMSRDIESVAVNRREGAVATGRQVGSLSEMTHGPDVVVLATPSTTVEALVAESVRTGAKAIIVLASIPPEARPRIAARCGGRIALLGGSSLGFVDANRGVVLSSSVSLELPLRGGPLALVSQSGALMGLLHAKATSRRIGLGMCIATGEQVVLRAEQIIQELTEADGVRAVGAYLEDLDPVALEHAALALEEARRPLVVLKGGTSARGAEIASSHSGALGSDGRAFRALARELRITVADDPDDLLNLMYGSLVEQRRFLVLTLSGGLAAVAADVAKSTGLPLAAAASVRPKVEHEPGADVIPTNPLDLERVTKSDQEMATLIETAAGTTQDLGIVLLLSDRPALEGLLASLAELPPDVRRKIVICSECSEQYETLLQEHPAGSRGVIYGIRACFSMLAKRDLVAPLGTRHTTIVPDEPCCPDHSSPHHAREDSTPPGLLSATATWALLEEAGVPCVELRRLSRESDVDACRRLWGLPLVLKQDGVGHRGTKGVVICNDVDDARTHFRRLSGTGAVCAQPVSEPGFEFFVGLRRDPVFGTLFLIGTGGPRVEALDDVAIAIGIPDRRSMRRLLDDTAGGAWLLNSLARPYVDVDALCDAAQRLGAAFEADESLVSLDVNPIIGWRHGAAVLDAKVRTRASASRPAKEDRSAFREAAPT